MIAKDIDYVVGGVRYVGTYFADDATPGRRPGVLVAPEGGGLVDHTRSIARRLAETGFAAFAMDYYGEGKAIVGFHSGLATARPGDAAAITAKVLVFIGADDPIIPPEQRAAFEQEMKVGGVDWRMTVHGGVGHSFTNPGVAELGRPGFAYDAAADRRSWAAMMELFGEVFG